jgi:hypothetical protein
MEKPIKRPAIAGRVTAPDDLQPAIDALSDIGRAWLKKHLAGRSPNPESIAKAADYERGEMT